MWRGMTRLNDIQLGFILGTQLVGSSKEDHTLTLNTIIEADHGALKRVLRPTRGFQTMKTAAAMIKGFEVMRRIRQGHCLTCKFEV